MNTSRIHPFRHALTIIAVAILSLAATPSVAANDNRPSDVPFYARLGRGVVFHSDDWAAIVFYRPPSCVPTNFNLLDFFDIPGAFFCGPATTEGFEIRKEAGDPVPIMTQLRGLGAVPVWFVPWPAFEAAMADDVLTIGELESLNPLIGSASAFHETLRPWPAVRLSTIEFNARGTLADGRTFLMNASAKGVDFTTEIAHMQVVFR